MKKVAVFDIDGTLFRSSLLIELVEEFIDTKVFPPQARKEYQNTYKKWLHREGTYEAYIDSLVNTFMRHLKGVDYSDFALAAKNVVDKNQNKLYVYTRDLLQDLKKKGYFLLAISQSPKGILDRFCKKLGFDKVYGRFYELGPSDKFTGEVAELPLIANKANILKRAIEKEELTLKGSIAVGDTEGDIPLLEMVDTPICFNPNARLYKFAKLNKWKVIVERKDVIYEIN